jgi:hypothetical protein
LNLSVPRLDPATFGTPTLQAHRFRPFSQCPAPYKQSSLSLAIGKAHIHVLPKYSKGPPDKNSSEIPLMAWLNKALQTEYACSFVWYQFMHKIAQSPSSFSAESSVRKRVPNDKGEYY